MKKTCEFYATNVRYTADVLDVVPIPGDEYFARGEVIVTVEEIYPIVPCDRAMNGAAYRLETVDDGVRYERFCFVPFNDEPARISVNNGRTYCTPAEAIAALPWNVIVNAMDDDTREQIAAEGYDTEEAFLTAYLAAAPCDLIIG